MNRDKGLCSKPLSLGFFVFKRLNSFFLLFIKIVLYYSTNTVNTVSIVIMTTPLQQAILDALQKQSDKFLSRKEIAEGLARPNNRLNPHDIHVLEGLVNHGLVFRRNHNAIKLEYEYRFNDVVGLPVKDVLLKILRNDASNAVSVADIATQMQFYGHELTSNAREKLSELVRQGYAEKVGTDQYRYVEKTTY